MIKNFQLAFNAHKEWFEKKYSKPFINIFNFDNINLPSTGLPYDYDNLIGFYSKLDYDPDYEGKFKLLRFHVSDEFMPENGPFDFTEISNTLQVYLFNEPFSSNLFIDNGKIHLEYTSKNIVIEVYFEKQRVIYYPDIIEEKKLWKKAKRVSDIKFSN